MIAYAPQGVEFMSFALQNSKNSLVGCFSKGDALHERASLVLFYQYVALRGYTRTVEFFYSPYEIPSYFSAFFHEIATHSVKLYRIALFLY